MIDVEPLKPRITDLMLMGMAWIKSRSSNNINSGEPIKACNGNAF
jgi:hypothetical protein